MNCMYSLLALCGLFAAAQASVIESFSYNTGVIGNTSASGTGLTNNWGNFVFSGNTGGSANLPIASGSYSAPSGYGFTPTGNRMETAGTTFNEVAVVNLTAGNYLDFNSDSVVYVSFLLNAFRNGNTGSQLSFVSGDNASLIQLGELNSIDGFLGVTAGGSSSTSSGLMDADIDLVGTQNLAVFKITTSSTGNDTIEGSFWNSATGTVTGEPMAWDVTHSFSESGTGVALRIDTSDGFANLTSGVDEIRIGNSFSEVTAIPEPSTLMLLGLALGSLGLFRRRIR